MQVVDLRGGREKDDRLPFMGSRPGANRGGKSRRAGDADGYYVEAVVLLVAD